MKNKFLLSTRIGIWLVIFSLLSAIVSGAGYFYFISKPNTERQKNTLILTNTDLSKNLNAILLEKIRVIQTFTASKDMMREIEDSNIEYGQVSHELRVERIKNENESWRKSTSLEDPIVQSRLDSPTAITLKNHIVRNPGIYGEIFITNKYGVVVGTTGKLTTLAHRQKYWWQASYAEGKGKTFIDDRGFDDSVGGVVLGLVVPVRKGKEIIGIIKANLNMGTLLKDFIDLTREGRNYDFSIYRSGGLVILDRKHEPLGSKAPDDISDVIKQREPNGLIYRHNITTHIHTSAPVSITLGNSETSFGGKESSIDHKKGNAGEFWVISLSQSIPVVDWSKPETRGFILFFLLMILLIPVMGVWVVRGSLSSLRQFSLEVENFDLEKPFLGNRDFQTNEVQGLAISFDKLVDRLRKTLVSQDELIGEAEQRKKTEKKLREQEWRYRSVTDSILDAIIGMNVKGEIISWNKGAELIFGYTQKKMMGKSMEVLMPERFKEAHSAGLKRVLETGEMKVVGKTVELTALNKDGVEFPIELTLGTWHGNQDVFFSGVIRDITERKLSEKSLKDANEKNEMILKATAEGIYGLDINGITTFANPATTQMIGWEEEELIGKFQHEILHHTKMDGSLYPRDECPIYASINDGVSHHVDTEVFWHKDGSSFPVEYKSTPIKKNGKIIGVVVSFSDITERKESEKVIRQSLKMDSLGNLAGGIAHDVNNMLLPIISLSEMTMNDLPEGHRGKKRLEKVVEAGVKARDLIAGILAFSHRSDLDVKGENISIVNLIEETLDILRSTLPSTITVTDDLDPNTGMVYCDSSQISSILLNMASNTVDALEGHVGELSIFVVPMEVTEHLAQRVPNLNAGQFAKLTVTDTGKGMDAETLNHIFDPFFTTKQVGEGTGLGLAMAHGIIIKHDGAIGVSSEVGVGTTFDIYLPIVEERE